MHARWLVLLGIGLAVITPVAVGETETSFSLKQLRTLARSVHPTLESAEAAVEAATGALRQARAYPNPELAVAFGRGRPRDGGDSRSENSFVLMQPIERPGLRPYLPLTICQVPTATSSPAPLWMTAARSHRKRIA